MKKFDNKKWLKARVPSPTDFLSFAFLRHLSSHVWISENCLWRILYAISESRCAANIAVSSAYVAAVTYLLIGRSTVYKIYRTGLNTLPWWDGYSDMSCPRSIEVDLFLFCRLDQGARLFQKLVGCLGKLQSIISFIQLNLRLRYSLCRPALLLSDYYWSQIRDLVLVYLCLLKFSAVLVVVSQTVLT